MNVLDWLDCDDFFLLMTLNFRLKIIIFFSSIKFLKKEIGKTQRVAKCLLRIFELLLVKKKQALIYEKVTLEKMK